MRGIRDSPLLALLQATVNNPKLFDMSGVTDPREFKAELREAWGRCIQRRLGLGRDVNPESNELASRPTFPGRP